MLRGRLGLLLAVLLASACGPGRLKVQSYWGTTTERLAAGSLYDWWTAADTTRATGGEADERLVEVIRGATEAELAALGYQKRPPDTPPDFWVSLHLGRGFQPSPRGPEDRATLAIEVRAVTDGHLVYRGWADAVVAPALPPEVRRERIEHAVHEILKPFAPG